MAELITILFAFELLKYIDITIYSVGLSAFLFYRIILCARTSKLPITLQLISTVVFLGLVAYLYLIGIELPGYRIFFPLLYFLLGFNIKVPSKDADRYILVSLLALISGFLLSNFFTTDVYGEYTRLSNDISSISIAYWASLFILVTIERKRTTFTGVLLLLSILVLVKSGSRGSLIYLFISLVLFYWKNIRKLIGFRSVLVMILLLYYSKSIWWNNWLRFKLLFTNLDEDVSSSERVNVYERFYESFGSNILGNSKYDFDDYSHNIFIELMELYGLFGVILSFILIWTTYSIVRRKSLIKIHRVAVLFSLLSALSSFSLINNKVLWIGTGLFLYERYSFISRRNVSAAGAW